MKLRFEIDTHKDKGGHWIAQVLLGGVVIHEADGPVSESQAVANATTSFAYLLRGAIDRQQAWEMGELAEDDSAAMT